MTGGAKCKMYVNTRRLDRYLYFMWTHSSFLQFTFIPLGNFLLLGGPTKGALTLFLSTLQ